MVRKQISAQVTVTVQWAYLYFCWKFLTEMFPLCVWVARKGRNQSTICSVANTRANTHKCPRGETDNRDGIYVNYTALRIENSLSADTFRGGKRCLPPFFKKAKDNVYAKVVSNFLD